jgi:predicted RecB family endonuclease
MDEIIDAEFEPEIENKEIIIPITNLLDKPIAQEGEIDRLISDDKLLSVYQDVLTAVQKDREEISEILQSFLDMVLNEGDATSACKEAVVSLVKAKSETNDQVIKIADLMTRVKMKERNTFNPAIHAHQQNIYNLGKTDEDKDVLLQEIEKAAARGKKI